MSHYIIGLLSFPALVIAGFAAYVACRWALYCAAKAAAGFWTLARPDWPQQKRAGFAALCYGAERGWMVVVGDLGLAVFVGQNHERRKQAADRLTVKRTYKLAARWAKPTETEDDLDEWADAEPFDGAIHEIRRDPH